MDTLHHIFGRLELYEALADWLRTLVAVLGLGVATYLPFVQHRHAKKAEQRRCRARARSLALAIFPELLELKLRVDYLARNIGHLLGPAHGAELHDRLGRAIVVVPPALQQSVPAMHLLGPAAGAEAQQLVALLAQYNRMLESLRIDLARGASMADGYFPVESLRPHLEAARTLANNAVDLVGRIQDGDFTTALA